MSKLKADVLDALKQVIESAPSEARAELARAIEEYEVMGNGSKIKSDDLWSILVDASDAMVLR